MKLGRAQTGQLFPTLAWEKAEKALISPDICWSWSGPPYSFVWRNQAFSNLLP
jgi:hypothetical protein